jgi:hypothetical protein
VLIPLARRYQGVLTFASSTDPALFTRFNQLKPESVTLVMVKEDPEVRSPSLSQARALSHSYSLLLLLAYLMLKLVQNDYRTMSFIPGTESQVVENWYTI